MQTLEAEQAAAMDKSRRLPEFGPGDIIEIKVVSEGALSMLCLQIKCNLTAWPYPWPLVLLQAVPENRRKVALMKGVVIARKNRGWQSAFTIRNYLGNAGGIERTFPLWVVFWLPKAVLITS